MRRLIMVSICFYFVFSMFASSYAKDIKSGKDTIKLYTLIEAIGPEAYISKLFPSNELIAKALNSMYDNDISGLSILGRIKEANDMYKVYYFATRKSSLNLIYSSIKVFKLNTNVWMFQSHMGTEWVIVNVRGAIPFQIH